MPYDITSGQQFRAVTNRMTTMGLHLPDSAVEEGLNWFPSVHEVVNKQASNIDVPPSQAAGIVAAVSPNMNFDARNIKALDEIRNITPEGWDMVRAKTKIKAPDGKIIYRRLPETGAMLKEVAPSLASAYDTSRLKAESILGGQPWREVLSARTSPKTYAFAENIEDPTSTSVTIDGRAADIVANQRRDWKADRGIGTANLVSGKESRYERHERAYQSATSELSQQDTRFTGATPKDVQAVLWVGGRGVERSQPTKSGGQRKVGEARVGQPYVTPGGKPLKRDSRFWEQA